MHAHIHTHSLAHTHRHRHTDTQTHTPVPKACVPIYNAGSTVYTWELTIFIVHYLCLGNVIEVQSLLFKIKVIEGSVLGIEDRGIEVTVNEYLSQFN